MTSWSLYQANLLIRSSCTGYSLISGLRLLKVVCGCLPDSQLYMAMISVLPAQSFGYDLSIACSILCIIQPSQSQDR